MQLHRRIAEALEMLYADSIDDHLGALAAHYLASTGSVAEKAVEYSVRAGNRAREMVAWEEAALHYQSALDAMPGNFDSERRCRVLLNLGETLYNVGDRPGCIEAWRGAASAARTAGSAALLGEAVSAFEYVANNVSDPVLPAERLELIDEALEALSGEDSALRGQLLALRVRASHAASRDEGRFASGGWGSEQGHLDSTAFDQMRKAIAMAERVSDPRVIVRVLGEPFSWLLVRPGNQTEKREMIEKAVLAGRQVGGVFEGEAWHNLFQIAIAQGDMVAARAARDRLAELAKDTKSARMRSLATTMRATLALAEGRLVEGEEAIFEALNLGQSINSATAPFTFAAHLSLLRQYQGRFAEMVSALQVLVDQSPDVATFKAGLALALVEGGKTDEGARMLDKLVSSGFEEIPEDGQWMLTMSTLAEVCTHIASTEARAKLYDLMSRHPEGCVTTGNVYFGTVSRTLGTIATGLERWDEAGRQFLSSIGLAEREGLWPVLAQTRLNYADMLLRSASTGSALPGDRGKARALLQQALEAAREMGMARVVADCERLLAEAG